MFLLKKPTTDQLAQLREEHHFLPCSYPEIGRTRDNLPEGYRIDHHRVQLGTGRNTFVRAQQAFQSWQMTRLPPWLEPCWPHAPLEQGEIVGTLAHVLGLWSLNICRIVYTFDEPAPNARFGFAYGTLPGHAERGEKRYQLEWHAEDDSVWYDLLAFSRPGAWITWLGYPYVRHMQKRFALESMQAMQQAVATKAPHPALSSS